MKYVLKHWKTSLIAAICATFTALVAVKIITVEQWVLAMGTIGAVGGVLAKDWDKVSE